MESLESRLLLTSGIMQVGYFPTWAGGIIPSTDPAGIAYHAPSGHLFIADSEIDELSGYNGRNIFETTLKGDQLVAQYATTNKEPTGITYNEYDGYFYVTNDDARSITRYDAAMNPLQSVKITTMDSLLTDPEGITSDPAGNLYVINGGASTGYRVVAKFNSNMELQSTFSVSAHMSDGEGIAYDQLRQHLFVVNYRQMAVFEWALDGTFIAKHDMSGFSPAPKTPQGLTFGPTSNPDDDPAAMALYIADGGVDNSRDGGIYEAVLLNTPPVLTAVSTLTGASEDTPFPISYAALAAAADESDANSDPIAFRIESVTSGTLTKNGTAVTPGTTLLAAGESLVWTPAANAVGALPAFTVRASDGQALSLSPVTVNVEVQPANDAPAVASPIADQTVSQRAAYSFTFAAGTFSDIDGDALTYAATQANGSALPAWLSFDAATRTFSGNPAAAETRTVSLKVTATDPGGAAASDEFQLVINDPPVLSSVNSFTGAQEDQAYSISYVDLAAAADESDANGDPIVFRIESVDNGILIKGGAAVIPGVTLLAPGESLIWIPAANANGLLGAFAVRAWDGLTPSATAVPVQVSVLAVNDAPSFIKGPGQAVNEDAGPQTVSGWATAVSAGPADEAGQTLTFLVTADNNALFAAPPVIDTAGNLTYTPAADAFGSATVTVRLQDNGGGADTSAPQTFLIAVNAVNDAPSFVKGADQTVAEDSGAQVVAGWATSISAGPPAEAGQTLTFVVTTNNNALFAALPSIDAGGTLRYTPAPDRSGSVTVTVFLQDNGGTALGGVDTSAQQTFMITVSAINDPPSFVKGADQTVAEDSGAQAVAGWATSISAGPPDESGQTLTFVLSTNNHALFAVLPSIDAGGTLRYTPAPDLSGSATVTVFLQDNGGTAGGGVDTSAQQTFTITVNPVNDPPQAVNPIPDQTTSQGAVFGFTFAANTFSDIEGSPLAYAATKGDGSALPLWLSFNAATRTFSGTPTNADVGTITVRVTASDGSDTASDDFLLTVLNVNDPPTLQNVNTLLGAAEDQAFTITYAALAAAADENDIDGDAVLFRIESLTSGTLTKGGTAVAPGITLLGPGESLLWTPPADANGAVGAFAISAWDGQVNSATAVPVSVAVEAVNDVPSFLKGLDQTAGEDAGVQTIAGWAAGISAGPANEAGQSLTFVIATDNSALFAGGPAIDSSGTLSYTPAPNAVGTATVTVRLQDNGGVALGGVDTSAEQSFTITITPVNDPPSFVKGADQTVAEDSGAQTVAGWAASLIAGPPDESGQTFTFLAATDNSALFANGPVIDSTGTLTYTPAPNAVGMATVTVRLQDNGGVAGGGVDTSAPQTFTITLTPINDPPSFLKGLDQTVAEDSGPQTVAGWATNIFAGPSDESGQTLSFLITADNSALFAAGPAIDSSGTLTYTPAPNAIGTATLTVRVQDNGGIANGGADTSAPQTFTITVNPVNDPPTFLKGADQTVAEDSPAQTVTGWATSMSAGPPDESGQTLTFMATTTNNALFGELPWIDVGGTLHYTPAPDVFGSAIVTVVLRDNGGLATGGIDTSAEQTFTITVAPVNDAPRLVTPLDDRSTSQGALFRFTFPADTFLDVEGDPLTYTATRQDGSALPLWLNFNAATRTFSGTPSNEDVGTISIRVNATDGSASDNDVFALTVNNVNDPPSLNNVSTLTGAEEDRGFVITYVALAAAADEHDVDGNPVLFRIESVASGSLMKDGAPVVPGATLLDFNESLVWTPPADVHGVLEAFSIKAWDGEATSATAVPVNIAVQGINDAPSFVKGMDLVINEDAGPQAVDNWATGMIPGPADEAGQTLAFLLTTSHDAKFAALPSIDSSGRLTYTPAPNAFGPVTVSVRLRDSGGTALGGLDTSPEQAFTITMNPIDDPPTLGNVNTLTGAEEDREFVISYTAFSTAADETDVDGDTLSFRVESVTSGTLTKNGTAVVPGVTLLGPGESLSWLPPANVNGAQEAFTVRVWDGLSVSAAAVAVNVDVQTVNDAPSFVRGADQIVSEDAGAQTVTGWATGMVAGPADELGQTLAFLVTTDSPGVFAVPPAIDAAGRLTYTPAPDAFGSATVTVRLQDSGGTDRGGADISAAQTFTITVNAVNDPPTLGSVGNLAGAEEDRSFAITYEILAAAANTADVEGDTIAFRIESVSSGTLTKGGVAVVAGTTLVGPGESLSWLPTADANGLLEAFTVRAWDGQAASATAVSVNLAVQAINDAPSFTKGANHLTDEDAGLQTVDGWATVILPGPADEASQSLRFLVTTDNDALFAVLPAIDSTGKLTYTPAPDVSGTATVTVRLRDDGGTANGGTDTSAPQTFTITVNPVNDVPSFTKGADQTVDEDAGVQTLAGWATGMLAGPADEAGQVLSFLVTTDNAALFAVLPAIDSTGKLTYTPAANAFGSATVTVRLRDDGGTFQGGVDTSAPQTFTITINPVNDAPSFTKGPDQTVNEDAGEQTVTGWASAMASGPANEAAQTLSFLLTTDNPALFAVPPAIDTAGKLTYTPAPDAFGSATVTVRLQDNGGTDRGGADVSAAQTFTITINAVNDPPTLGSVDNLLGAEEDRGFTITYETLAAAADEADVEGDTIAFRIESASSGTLTKGGVAVVAGTTLVSPGESLSWLPTADANGLLEAFTVRAWDGQAASATAVTVNLAVQAINDAPSFTKGANHLTDEDAGMQTVDGWATVILPGPADEASQSLSFLVTTDNDALFAVLPAIDSTGKLTYTPAPDVSGTATVTVRLRDDGGTANGGADTSAPQTFTITITPVNDVPSFTKGADQTVDEDAGAQTLAGWATGMLAGPADEAGQVLSFLVTTDNAALFAVLPAIDSAGKLTYTPAANAFGSTTVTVRLSDDGGTLHGGVDTSAPQTFTITINPVNDAPSFTKGEDQTVNEDAGGQTVTGWASAMASGPANEAAQTLSFLLTTDNPALFAVPPAVDAAGKLSYTSAPNISGSATVTVRLRDSGGVDRGGTDISAAQTFRIIVNAVNDAPSFTKGADQSVYEDAGAQAVSGWATAILPGPADETSQTLTFAVTTDNDALFAVPPSIDASSGTLTYTPAVNAFGSATVTVRLRDNAGTALGGVDVSAPQTFTITVIPVNDVPSFVKGANQTVAEDAGSQTVGGWATAMSPGPADEVGQAFTFLVATDNDALFAVLPSIDASGTLTYTSAANAFGSATVTVRLRDSGGTVGGGVDTSAAQTFTITVTPVNDPPTLSSVSTLAGAKEDTAFVISFNALAAAANELDVEADALVFRIESVTSGTLTKGGVAVTPGATLLGPGSTLVWTPTVNANGTLDAFTIRAWDGQAISSMAAPVRVLVQAVNDAPSFTKGANQVIGEDAGPQTVVGWATGVSPGPADEASQGLLFQVSTNNDSLFAVLPSMDPLTRALSYTPAPNAHGSATVTVRLKDDGGTLDGGVNLSSAQTFTITVNPVNDAPSLSSVAALAGAIEDTTFAISYAALADAANEADVDGDAVVFRIESVNSGTLTKGGAAVIPGATLLLPGQSLIWTRPANIYGLLDVFTIRAWDGQAASAAAVPVPVDVQAVNDAPSFLKGADQVVLEDAGAQTVNGWATSITAGPSNEAGQSLAFLVTTNNNALFAVLPSIDSSGTLTYTPSADAVGSATVTVRLQDGGGTAFGGVDTSAPQTFTITVNAVQDPPTLSQVNPFAGAKEDTAFAISYDALAVAADEADVDGDSLVFRIESLVSGMLMLDTAAVQPGVTLLTPGKSLLWTPAAHANGLLDAFTIRAWDGQQTSMTAVPVKIGVLPVNDPPSFTKGADHSADEDSPAQTVSAWATAISPGPADETGQTLDFLVTTNNDTLFAVLPSIDRMTGHLTYTPAPNAFGSAIVTVRLRDNGGTADGGVDISAQQTFTITIRGVNDPPAVANPITERRTSQGAPFSFTFAADTFRDIDGDPLTYLASQADGSALPAWLNFDAAARTFSGTPAHADVGAITVRLTASDSSGSSANLQFQITVTDRNDPPTLSNVSSLGGATEDMAYAINHAMLAAAADEADVDGDSLAFRIESVVNGTLTKNGTPVVPGVTLLVAGESLLWTPAANANGVVQAFTIRAWDGQAASASAVPVAVEVSAVNDAPSFAKGANLEVDEDAGAQTVSGWATAIFAGPANEADQTLTFLVTTDNGSLFAVPPSIDPANGNLSYTPAADAFGSATVTVRVQDNGGTAGGGADLSASQTFTITVHAVNDPPLLVHAIPDQGASQGAAFSFTFAADVFHDIDGGLQTYSATQADGSALPAWLSFDAAARTFSGTPAQADVGTITIRVTASDSLGGSAADEFVLTVSNTNDAPTLSHLDALAGASEDTAHAISYAALAAAADEADVDGDPIAFRIESVSSGTLTKGGVAVVPGVTLLAAGESLLWTPAANANGAIQAFTIRAWDGQAASASAVPVIVEVSSVNDSPSFVKGANQVVQEDAAAQTVSDWAAAVSAGPGDEAGQTLAFLVNTDSPGLFAVSPTIDSLSGNLTYTPAANASGSATVTVRLQDNGGTAGGGADTSAPQTFTITVNAVNDSPTLSQANTLLGASESMEYAISYADLAAAADEADVDGDAVAFRVESVVSGTLTKGGAAVVPGVTLLAAGESLLWTPAAHANGVLEAFTIRAWDGQATSASAVTILVDVSAVNAPPVAVPGGPYHAGFASSLVLDGSNSYDPDTGSGESIVRYRWDLGDDGQWDYEGAQANLPWAALSSLPPDVSIPVRLEVTDSEGLAASATTGLTIASAELLNSVDFLVLSSQELSAEGQWYQLSPRYDGLLTIEALRENAQLDLFDSSLAPLGSSSLVDGHQRLDHTVSAGGTFYVRLRGETGAADLRVTNLVRHEGTTVTVHGTSGSDQVRFDISSGGMSIKDVAYSFAGAATVAFDGSGGEDHVDLTGSGESDVAVLRPHSATLHGNGYAIAATHIASSTFEGGGGQDIARLYGTARADAITLVDQASGSASPPTATLTGGGASISAAAEVVYASGGGGRDTADVYRPLSLAEEETAQGYESFWKRARMWGSGYYGELRRFREVAAHANENPTAAVLRESTPGNGADTGSLPSPLQGNAAVTDALIGHTAGTPADDISMESMLELLWLDQMEQQQDRTKASRTAEVNAVDQAFTYWE